MEATNSTSLLTATDTQCLRPQRKTSNMHSCLKHPNRPKQSKRSTSTSSRLLLNRKSLVLGAILISLAVFVLNPAASSDQLVEGKKVKKAIKTLVKGLVLQNLSTRKNFLPLPVPIPGKWQQFFTTMLDSGVLDVSSKKALMLKKGATELGHRLLSSSASLSGALGSNKHKQSDLLNSYDKKFGGKKFLLFSAGSLVDSLSKFGSKNKQSEAAAAATQQSSSVDIQNIKKLTRLAAARYAGKIISNQAPGGSASGGGGHRHSSTSTSLVQKASSTATDRVSSSGQQRNDMLVTAFNVVKLAQQIRQLDPSNLLKLNLSKKTSFPASSSSSSAAAAAASSSSARFPILSMNINNRKTFLNKMHYIHKLTSDLHHRHRNNQNLLAFAV